MKVTIVFVYPLSNEQEILWLLEKASIPGTISIGKSEWCPDPNKPHKIISLTCDRAEDAIRVLNEIKHL